MPAAFRLYPTFQTFFSDDGTLLAGGQLRFKLAGTSTPKDVYGEKALSTNNGSTIDLDAAGRPEHPIWGSGQYDVDLYDADGVKVGEDLTVEIPGGEASALPALSADKFLTNDGSVMSWADIEQVPDPTGSANKILGTDGTTISWVDRPANGADATNVGADATSFHVDDMYVVTGSATGTSVGGRTQDVSVTFGTAFTSAPVFVGIQITSSSVASSENMPSWSVTTSSTTGFTVKFTLGELDDSQGKYNFNAGVAFKYVAIGVRTS
jgi:hypothetical protein